MIKYIRSILKLIIPKDNVVKPLGRWRIENCNEQMSKKVDLSNEDHCGPCGQYASKIKEKKEFDLKKKN
jgi:hypothetical protein